MLDEIFWCTSCLVMSTRPRVSFDEHGRCNACQWAERKRTLDWSARQSELEELLDRKRSNNGDFDCIIPVSGGKDGSYVAYNLKHKYGMNPLAVTINPALPSEIGQKNLANFIQSGYPHVSVSPDPKSMRILNRMGFVEKGSPYFGWLAAITLAPLEIGARFGCNLVFYGEDGEVEYGGSSSTEDTPERDIAYLKDVYLEQGYEQVCRASGLSESELQFLRFPSELEPQLSSLNRLNWSYFESWDPYRNYLTAKEHCGLEDAEGSNSGTFTNFAQNDQYLYALHTYIMWLKFGFGRANQDACIEIRRGAMSREQGVELVRLYDGQYPHDSEEMYLDYFEMSRDEFLAVLRKWANPLLIDETEPGIWKAKFSLSQATNQ